MYYNKQKAQINDWSYTKSEYSIIMHITITFACFNIFF